MSQLDCLIIRLYDFYSVFFFLFSSRGNRTLIYFAGSLMELVVLGFDHSRAFLRHFCCFSNYTMIGSLFFIISG